jgi:hypothetical protein
MGGLGLGIDAKGLGHMVGLWLTSIKSLAMFSSSVPIRRVGHRSCM